MSCSKHASSQTGQYQEPSEAASVDNPPETVLDFFPCPSILECSICKEYATAPIYQCPNGHIMCSRCRALITTCPTCRIKMGDLIRNRLIEQIAEVLPFPCKYKVMGCSSLQPYTQLAEHEKYCNFRPVECPLRRNCEWMGPLSQLVDHLRTGMLIKIFTSDFVKFPAACALDRSRFSEWRMLQCCFGASFMFVLLKDYHNGATVFYAFVHILGSKKQSEKFTYSLELTSGICTSLAWKGTPIPYHDGMLDAVRLSKCMVIDVYSAKHFAKDGVLSFNVKIFMKPQ